MNHLQKRKPLYLLQHSGLGQNDKLYLSQRFRSSRNYRKYKCSTKKTAVRRTEDICLNTQLGLYYVVESLGKFPQVYANVTMAQIIISSDNKTKAHASNMVSDV